MEKEKKIITLKPDEISNIGVIDKIVSLGYQKTGNKFWVSFFGSKCYLSNITVQCEGEQHAINKVFINDIFDGIFDGEHTPKPKTFVYIFHSELRGVRVSVTDSKPLSYEDDGSEERQRVSDKADKEYDDLDF